jgi:hypothetical protein
MFHWIISLQNTMKLYLSTVFSNLNLIKKQIVNSGRIELIKLLLEIKPCFFLPAYDRILQCLSINKT